MPFNLTYELNVVMPMECLVPNLRIFVKERLTGNTLSKSLFEPEKLEEAHLQVIYGMIVDKLQ